MILENSKKVLLLKTYVGRWAGVEEDVLLLGEDGILKSVDSRFDFSVCGWGVPVRLEIQFGIVVLSFFAA